MMRTTAVPAGVLLLLLAALWVLLVAPQAGRIDAGAERQFYFDAQARSRERPGADWERTALVGRRIDTPLVSTDERVILQSDVYWALPDGRLYFENASVYAVDRLRRTNLPGLGSVSRTGHFMFPHGVEPITYTVWDSHFIGPRTMEFRRRETRDGLTVYRFAFRVTGLDETAGYSHLPDVPERYRAHTDGQGEAWVEPRTGLVVDYVEQGRSYFLRAGGIDGNAFFSWEARFTPKTRALQAQRAHDGRRRMLLAQFVVPGALALLGMALLVAGVAQERRRRA